MFTFATVVHESYTTLDDPGRRCRSSCSASALSMVYRVVQPFLTSFGVGTEMDG